VIREGFGGEKSLQNPAYHFEDPSPANKILLVLKLESCVNMEILEVNYANDLFILYPLVAKIENNGIFSSSTGPNLS
jgi:hypothetical protein